MTDNKADTGTPDRDRINLGEDYEVRYWSQALGMTEAQLREAVKAAGSSAEAVRRHLGK